MSGEAAKERVTPVPSKSQLLTYFRFGSAQCTSCGLAPTKKASPNGVGPPGSSNLPWFYGKSLSLSPVRLAISLWLGQSRSAE